VLLLTLFPGGVTAYVASVSCPVTASVNKIHHINFLVRDLDEAEARFRRMLGLGESVREALPARGVLTARFAVGETWLVLVQPVSDEGEPARLLRERGEGFFLLSFGVDDLEDAVTRARDAGASFASEQARSGLAGWRVMDFDPAETWGDTLQLTEE